MRSPRVAIVIPRYHPLFGGAENQCARLVEALTLQGEVRNTFLVTGRWTSDLARSDIIGGILVCRVGVPGMTRWSNFAFYASVIILLLKRKEEWDVVHCHATSVVGMISGIVAVLLGKDSCLKLSSNSELAPLATKDVKMLGRQAYLSSLAKRLVSAVASRLSIIIALNREGYAEAIRADSRRVVLIPNGVDRSKFKPAAAEERKSARGKFGINENDIVCLFMGRFVGLKRIDILISAVTRIAAQREENNVTLLLAGSAVGQADPISREIEAARCKLGAKLKVLEATNEPWKYYQIADLYLSAASREGMPNSVVEALACGLPCILSNIAPHREIQELNRAAPIALACDSASDFQNKILQFAAYRHKSQHVAAQSYLDPQFDLVEIARRYASLYRKIAFPEHHII